MTTANKHNTRVVLDAVRLREAGWSTAEVAQIIGASRESVLRWTDRGYADKVNARQRRAWARRWSFRLGGNPSHEYKMAFIHRLRAEGVSMSGVAKVCTVVFDEPWSTEKVRYRLRGR